MSKFKNKYRIESNRWKYWDYSAPGRYFITCCIENRECILGDVVHDEMKLSPLGEIVHSEIEIIPTYHKRIVLDEWVVMPDHFHVIIELKEYDFDNGMCNVENDDTRDTVGGGAVDGPDGAATPHHKWWHIPDYRPTNDEIKQYRKFRRKMIIPKTMGKIKMLTSKQMNLANNTPGNKNWQRDYHDHVIRDDRSYRNIVNYIRNNPSEWRRRKENS